MAFPNRVCLHQIGYWWETKEKVPLKFKFSGSVSLLGLFTGAWVSQGQVHHWKANPYTMTTWESSIPRAPCITHRQPIFSFQVCRFANAFQHCLKATVFFILEPCAYHTTHVLCSLSCDDEARSWMILFPFWMKLSGDQRSHIPAMTYPEKCVTESGYLNTSNFLCLNAQSRLAFSWKEVSTGSSASLPLT